MKTRHYTPEIKDRAVRMLIEALSDYPSTWPAIQAIAPKIGCTPETLRSWHKKHIDQTIPASVQAQSQEQRIKELERENKELKQANEIIRKAAAFFGPGGARPLTKIMIQFIDDHKNNYGVELICRVLPIAPSTYHRAKDLESYPEKRSLRSQHDDFYISEIKRIWQDSKCRYGARKVWQQMKADGLKVARCTIERLMRQHGLQGVWRGKGKITTHSRDDQKRADDLVNRNFSAHRPNQLWVADFTYIKTISGWVYTAFIIDVFARAIVGWKVSNRMNTDMVMAALNQAIADRNYPKDVIHHSDRGVQYLSIRYTDKMATCGVIASVGTTGDSYDNALAETVNGLYKSEVIHYLKQNWTGVNDVELATLEWVDWFNKTRLHSTIGYVSPFEFEKRYYDNLILSGIAA
ncbi:IS3 family transposase [Psychrobacter sp. M9-54-1]|uniref:IS3 family transposase n=1 Tax=Psychrobacter sp. M9-54-1 TaxID=2782386 RepID=UPI0019092D04|nr:IS3 family transposase [Psychrobacter sp. M9-54-1]MBK3392554.1 IS3 family transposase [Psychrobacter sp. M9-54-1]